MLIFKSVIYLIKYYVLFKLTKRKKEKKELSYFCILERNGLSEKDWAQKSEQEKEGIGPEERSGRWGPERKEWCRKKGVRRQREIEREWTRPEKRKEEVQKKEREVPEREGIRRKKEKKEDAPESEGEKKKEER